MDTRNHPKIIKYIYSFEDNEGSRIVMKYTWRDDLKKLF